MYYETIGTTVFLTGLMASLSGLNGALLLFDSWPSAIALALLWGCVVFTIDRTLVASIGRRSGDGLLAQVPLVLVRFAVAASLALVIAKPLELLVFRTRIDAGLAQRDLQVAARADRMADSMYAPRFALLRRENEHLSEALAEKERAVAAGADAAAAEGAGHVSPLAGPGRLWQTAVRRYSVLQQELTELRRINGAQIARNRLRLDSLERIRSMQANKVLAAQSRNLSDRLEMLGELRRERSVIWWTDNLFILALLWVDLAPILAKLLGGHDAYEARMRMLRQETIQSANTTKEISRIEEEGRQKRAILATERTVAVFEDAWLRVVHEALASDAFKQAREDVARELAQIFSQDQRAVVRAVQDDHTAARDAGQAVRRDLRQERDEASRRRSAADQAHARANEMLGDHRPSTPEEVPPQPKTV